jgi:hypothetical protein
MNLSQIFDTVQYGEKYMKQKTLKESIKRCYDEELDIFYASKRIKQLSGEVVMTEAEEQKVNRIIGKVVVLEDRLEDGKLMSDAYRKMQTAALMDDCTSLMEEATKSRKVDNRKLGCLASIVATTKYFVENSLDKGAALKESSNPLFNKLMKEEKENLEEIL